MVPLEAKVAFLSRPGSYPEDATEVTAVETHMSWVFLLEAHAYKLKKPVRYDFLDFSTLDAREECVRAEVRLNRRLGPDVYLGSVALTEDDQGALSVGGRGRVVDWLVRMRRLPAELMLDRCLAEGRARESDARRLGELLARFHAHARRARVAPERAIARIERELAQDRVELAREDLGLPPSRVERVAGSLAELLDLVGPVIAERAERGAFVEGHGDLRPEHVCLESPPAVIDAIEFNRDLRTVDPVDDLALLTVECQRLGARWFGETVAAVHRERTGDDAPPWLARFYEATRALVRAKLAIWHLREPRHRADGRWPARARAWVELAEASTDAVARTGARRP